jgi:hypothetical protein
MNFLFGVRQRGSNTVSSFRQRRPTDIPTRFQARSRSSTARTARCSQPKRARPRGEIRGRTPARHCRSPASAPLPSAARDASGPTPYSAKPSPKKYASRAGSVPAFGSSFSKDGFSGETFDYLLANPPFGVEWKPDEDFIVKEHETEGFGRRFGAGLPRINDGSFLFLQHMISKMKPAAQGGSRIAIVFNGSPLFTGDAGSGESEIRKWIIENDWLDAIVALPDQLFYNTGISTYLWIVTNRKRKERRGKVQLINAVDLCQKMRRSLGNKRNELGEEDITIIMIEHIMQAVMRFSERVMCLDAGKIIAIGAPAEVMANKRVQEAYLGT